MQISDELFAWLRAENDNPRSQFLLDMEIKAVNGALTPNMISALERSFAKGQEFAAKKVEREAALAHAPKLAEGRYAFIGKVVSHKFSESQFGTQHKMLVEFANGNRVFGTMPAVLDNDFEFSNDPVGKLVALTAKVEAKEDHFGFYSRPKVNEVIDIEGAWAEELEGAES